MNVPHHNPHSPRHTTKSLHTVRAWTVLAALLAAGPTLPAAAKGRHVHGEGQLDIAIDNPDTPSASQPQAQKLTLQYRLPGEVLFGFEHEPRNDKERQTVAKALDDARKGAGDWLTLPTDLGCGQWSIQATDTALPPSKKPGPTEQPTAPQRGKKSGVHKDVLITVQGICSKSPAGASVTLAGFDALKRLRVLNIQILAQGVQSGVRLLRKSPQFQLGEAAPKVQP